MLHIYAIKHKGLMRTDINDIDNIMSVQEFFVVCADGIHKY